MAGERQGAQTDKEKIMTWENLNKRDRLCISEILNNAFCRMQMPYDERKNRAKNAASHDRKELQSVISRLEKKVKPRSNKKNKQIQRKACID